MQKNIKNVVIYTDGACSGNPGPGGWGAILMYNGHEKEICGGELETTNNRMELTAAIMALLTLKQSCNVKLYTDSKYVKDGITQWIHNWRRNNWKTGNKPVKNADLWKKLLDASSKHNISWQWIKGHDGNIGNEKADLLARTGMKKINI